jgi:hypothetical protein
VSLHIPNGLLCLLPLLLPCLWLLLCLLPLLLLLLCLWLLLCLLPLLLLLLCLWLLLWLGWLGCGVQISRWWW